MGLAEGILAVVLDAAEGQKVRQICLQVGKLQMVVPDSLEFSFQLVAEGTPAAEAVLKIEEVPACFCCKRCGVESELNHPPFTCPHCGALDVEVVLGDQILVDAVELESGVTIRRTAVAADEILEEHLKEHQAPDSEHEA
ncbi:MAG: hydrogenase maturation nickel metallochaperone HypA [Nitrososphaera sp.]|nr:hydrogenase maturation nickel metallochaperone HypA [Nitrososphaera sp.]